MTFLRGSSGALRGIRKNRRRQNTKYCPLNMFRIKGGKMIKETKTTLLCSWCFKESPILITSVGGFIVRMKCQRCGHIFKVPTEMFYFSLFSDWKKRILTKPARLAEEMINDPSSFTSSFPMRVITKPFRIAKEIEKCIEN